MPDQTAAGIERRASILRYIMYYRGEHPLYGPSLRDVTRACQITHNAVRQHVRVMREQGLVEYEDRSSRTLRVAGAKTRSKQ